mmetsp:Transcript_984/g.2284  ORF Transcript_984/g.2284 Transcript_984/m.2284 type:complete len:281 (-) Transcript_984:265-1107(-)
MTALLRALPLLMTWLRFCTSSAPSTAPTSASMASTALERILSLVEAALADSAGTSWLRPTPAALPSSGRMPSTVSSASTLTLELPSDRRLIMLSNTSPSCDSGSPRSAPRFSVIVRSPVLRSRQSLESSCRVAAEIAASVAASIGRAASGTRPSAFGLLRLCNRLSLRPRLRGMPPLAGGWPGGRPVELLRCTCAALSGEAGALKGPTERPAAPAGVLGLLGVSPRRAAADTPPLAGSGGSVPLLMMSRTFWDLASLVTFRSSPSQSAARVCTAQRMRFA